MTKRNIIANYLGQGWVALMGLVFLPSYIQYLGMEAFGLIGLFAVMQAWLTLLDMGMTPTLNREMARFIAGAHSPQSIRDLLRSLEVICYGLAAMIGFGVWSASGYLASGWLKAEDLPVEVVAQAISIMALLIALRFCEGIYRGALFGLKRQVSYNVINAFFTTIRYGGAWIVLAWISPTIEAFFIWHAAISLLTLSVFAVNVHRLLPPAPTPSRFSRKALDGVWKFAGGMIVITFLALLLTQVDKVLLSCLLRLEEFGYYTLAATIAGALYMIVGPITQAIYPRMVELVTSDDQSGLATTYHQGAQLITVLMAPAGMILSVFAGGVIFAWSGDANLAINTAPLLSVLVLGTFLNGLMWMPYQCQLAHGWTSLAIKVNIVAVLILIPAIFWIVPIYGAIGAAWIWAILNAGYMLIGVQFMHRRILSKEKMRWYIRDVFLPVGGAGASLLLMQVFQPTSYQDRWLWIAFLAITGSIALVVAAFLADQIRLRVQDFGIHC